MTPHWEHYPHQADMGVRGFGATKAQAFEQVALAMTAVVLDPATVSPAEAVSISLGAPDDGVLLVDWLNSLVFEMGTRAMVFSRFQVTIEDHTLTARAWGELVDRARHAPSVEVKGATFTDLSVRQSNGGWVAQCVVDV